MDPLTITTGVLSAVGSGIKAFKVYQSYATKYNLADLTIVSVRTECSTIRLALSRIHTIIAENETLRNVSNADEAADEMWEEYGVVLGACTLTFNVLHERLSNLGLDKVDEHNLMATQSKIKAVMNSDEMVCLIQNIRGQAQALSLLLQVFQAAITSKTYQLLKEERNSIILQAVSDNTQSLVGNLRQSRSLDSRFSIHSSLLGDEEFDFDDEVVNSKSYRRLLMQNRGHRRRTSFGGGEDLETGIGESETTLVNDSMSTLHSDSVAQATELDSQQADVGTTSTSNTELNYDNSTSNSSDIASNKTAALVDLKNRVHDWKNHRVDGFGELLLWGEYQITNSKGLSKPFKVYLFEAIILCCKEIRPKKRKSRTKLRNLFSRPKPQEPEEKETRLELKGRIFMNNITQCAAQCDSGINTVLVLWKGDPGIESFSISYETESETRIWWSQLDERRRIEHEKVHDNQQQAEWVPDMNDLKTTSPSPYSDSDYEEETESEPEEHPESHGNEALKLFQFHVTPTLGPEIDLAYNRI